MSFDPGHTLDESSAKPDDRLDLFLIALAFAAPNHPGISIDRYMQHMKKLGADVGARHRLLLESGAKDDAGAQLAALKYVLSEQEGYEGDNERYDDLQNADIMRVVDRRKGIPISLCILYICVGRANGWIVDGLNFPGHFLCRIEHGGERMIFDAFSKCEVLEAPQLRQLLKRVRGQNAELLADYYKPCTNRDTLVRLQNNIKLRLIEAEDYEGALEVVEMMRRFAPDEYRLLLDAGVLYAKTGRRQAARDILEKYITLAPNPHDRHDAELMLRELSDTLT